MTLEPRFDSPDPSERKLIHWVCTETGKCFPTKDEALAGSNPSITSRLR
jgi:hypothetical protein